MFPEVCFRFQGLLSVTPVQAADATIPPFWRRISPTISPRNASRLQQADKPLKREMAGISAAKQIGQDYLCGGMNARGSRWADDDDQTPATSSVNRSALQLRLQLMDDTLLAKQLATSILGGVRSNKQFDARSVACRRRFGVAPELPEPPQAQRIVPAVCRRNKLSN